MEWPEAMFNLENKMRIQIFHRIQHMCCMKYFWSTKKVFFNVVCRLSIVCYKPIRCLYMKYMVMVIMLIYCHRTEEIFSEAIMSITRWPHRYFPHIDFSRGNRNITTSVNPVRSNLVHPLSQYRTGHTITAAPDPLAFYIYHLGSRICLMDIPYDIYIYNI